LRAKPRNRRDDFEAQITKPELSVLRHNPENPPPPWFCGSTKKLTTGFEAKPGETVTTTFDAKLEKTVTTSFEAKLLETVAIGFEAKPLETVATGFEVKPTKTVRVVLRPNHSQTVDLGFKAQPRNPRSLSPHAQCRPHTAPLDLSITQPPSTDLCDHPWSSAPVLLLMPWSSSPRATPHLPPAHHETSKCDSPNETKIKEKQNETILDSNSNLAKSMTHHNQTNELTTWFLNLRLDESIDNKITKIEVRIQDPMKHS
jgi:hypothetical protein